jgi:hypothetical protein
MSLLGVAAATWIHRRYGDGTESIQATALAVALVAGGLGTVAKAALRRVGPIAEPFVLYRRDRIAAVCIGLVGGFVVGLTSVGSGVFFGLTMLIPSRSARRRSSARTSCTPLRSSGWPGWATSSPATSTSRPPAGSSSARFRGS